MATSRYTRTPIIAYGTQYGTGRAREVIQAAVANGTLATKQVVVRGRERLDTLAGVLYGDATYWWVLAAASNVGWGLQVPPGTILRVPSLKDVLTIVG